MSRRILVIAPHTDDGELGAGASIAKWTRRGDEVFYVALSGCETVVPAGLPPDTLRRELGAATQILGIPESRLIVGPFTTREFPARRQEVLELLLALRRDIIPEMVLMPSLGDTHQDHAVVAQEAFRAFKNRTLLSYELPWNSVNFAATAFSCVSEEEARRKVEGLACYRSQAHRTYMAPDFLLGQLRFRGVQLGQPFAEVFEVPRMILP